MIVLIFRHCDVFHLDVLLFLYIFCLLYYDGKIIYVIILCHYSIFYKDFKKKNI